MKVLIGCEESQVICQTFRKAGFNAYSNDLKSTKGDPKYHLKMDVFKALQYDDWDLIILHPPCTALCVSGNRYYSQGKPKYKERQKALVWTLSLWKAACKKANHVALENPVSVIFNFISPVQYIQPWHFGEVENKKTGFALWNLPPLEPTKIILNAKDTLSNKVPSKTRAEERARTFQGVADAIVTQWGNHIKGLNYA